MEMNESDLLSGVTILRADQSVNTISKGLREAEGT